MHEAIEYMHVECHVSWCMLLLSIASVVYNNYTFACCCLELLFVAFRGSIAYCRLFLAAALWCCLLLLIVGYCCLLLPCVACCFLLLLALALCCLLAVTQ